MKCPKCGFVSYAGLEQCKKCGYPFVKAAPKGSSSSLTSLFPEGVRLGSPTRPPEPLPEPREDSPQAEPELPTQQILTSCANARARYLPTEESLIAGQTARAWTNSPKIGEKNCRNELRTSASGGLVSSQTQIPRGNLELDFEDPDKPEDNRSH